MPAGGTTPKQKTSSASTKPPQHGRAKTPWRAQRPTPSASRYSNATESTSTPWERADGAAALSEAGRAKTQAQEERTAATAEKAQADQLLAEAERADNARRQNVEADNAQPEQLTDEAAATYDSAERREALAKSLDHIGDREAVEARLTADRNQATPPAAALSATHRKASQSRKTRSATGVTKQAQKDVSRATHRKGTAADWRRSLSGSSEKKTATSS
jgi:hypothetical protein